MKKVALIVLTGLFVASWSASIAAKELVVNAVAPTSDDYAMAVVWSNLVAKSGGEDTLTVVDNGTVKGLRMLAKGQVDISVLGSPHYLDAIQNKGQFKDDPAQLVESYKKSKALFAIRTSTGQYVARTDSGIKNFVDFRGKKFAIGRPGGNAGRVTKALLEVHGIDMEKETDAQYLKYAEAIESMASNNMDGTFVWGGIPHAGVDNGSRMMKLRFVSPDPTKLDEFRKLITSGDYYVFQKVPAETLRKAYDGRVEVDSDIYFWTFPFMFMVNDSMPEDTAYNLTKTLWSNVAEVNKTSFALSLISVDNAVDALSAELHPGAAKYFKEIGLLQ
jgi:TRAP transporter TAXI family solute receptor